MMESQFGDLTYDNAVSISNLNMLRSKKMGQFQSIPFYTLLSYNINKNMV